MRELAGYSLGPKTGSSSTKAHPEPRRHDMQWVPARRLLHNRMDTRRDQSPTSCSPAAGGLRGAPALDVNSATHRIDYTAEISQHPVAGVLDNSPAMFGHLVCWYRREGTGEVGCPFRMATNRHITPG